MDDQYAATLSSVESDFRRTNSNIERATGCRRSGNKISHHPHETALTSSLGQEPSYLPPTHWLKGWRRLSSATYRGVPHLTRLLFLPKPKTTTAIASGEINHLIPRQILSVTRLIPRQTASWIKS